MAPTHREIRGGHLILAEWLLASSLCAQQPKPPPGSEECVACHEAGARKGKREPSVPPRFDQAALRASPHANVECRSCHSEVGKEFPHPAKLPPVDCGSCHAEEKQQHSASLHGKAAQRGDPLAPGCTTCHGTHNIQPPSAPGSPTATTAVPLLCGRCHHEGSPVSLTHAIPQDKILRFFRDFARKKWPHPPSQRYRIYHEILA